LIAANDYREAIQAPELCFRDPELRRGRALRDPLGLPRAISGNFAAVFPIVCDRRRYAVKCFSTVLEDQLARYEAVGAHLNGGCAWSVDFEFQDGGIRVGGRWLPIVKMEWIDAARLDRFVESRLGDGAALLGLAGRFAELVRELRAAGIAHGDLQHGNVLVTAAGELRLVDYDGMFVPALEGRPSHELGHPNYQHPGRTNAHFGLELDNFSAWVIYASLVSLGLEPSIWERVGGGDEKLVFDRRDFEATLFSAGFGALRSSGDPRLEALALQLKRMLAGGVDSVPALAPLELDPREPARARKRGAGRRAPHSPSLAAVDELEAGLPRLHDLVAELPPPHRRELAAVGRTPPLVAVATIVVATTVEALGVLGLYGVAITIGALASTIAAALAAERILYGRLREPREKQERRQTLERRRGEGAALARECRRLLRRRAELEADERRALACVEDEVARLRKREEDELRDAERTLQRRLDELTEERLALHQREAEERARVLRELGEEAAVRGAGQEAVRRIRRRYTRLLEQHRLAEQQAREELSAGVLAIREAAQKGRLALIAEGNEVRAKGLEARRELELELARVRAALEQARAREARATRALEAYEGITFARFLLRASVRQ
jgi:hypothetical protein